MQKADIHPGHEYAMREPPATGSPLQRVKVLAHIRRDHWRVEWIDPNPGLVDFVRSSNLIVPWGDRKAFLRDERSAEELRRLNASTYPGDSSPVTEAVDQILDSTGEIDLRLSAGLLCFRGDVLIRVSARAGIEVPESPRGYRDRYGWDHLPFTCALELAQAFAGAEARAVLDPLDAEERKWSLQLREPGNGHLAPLLAGWRSSWALIRQWAGHDIAVAVREERIAELEHVLNRVMWDLRRPGADTERIATQIDRVLRER